MIQLNPNQVTILQAIKEGKGDTNQIAEITGLSVHVVRYYQDNMHEEGYIRCSKCFSSDGSGMDYSCTLKSKGHTALEDPNFLLQSNQTNASQTHIYAQTVGFVNSGTGTVTNFSLNIGLNMSDINQLINSIRQHAGNFPEEQRDEVLLSLEDLESDLSQPDKQQPKRIQRRIATLWAVACILSAGLAGVTDFSNNVLELAEKLGTPIEFNQYP